MSGRPYTHGHNINNWHGHNSQTPTVRATTRYTAYNNLANLCCCAAFFGLLGVCLSNKESRDTMAVIFACTVLACVFVLALASLSMSGEIGISFLLGLSLFGLVAIGLSSCCEQACDYVEDSRNNRYSSRGF